MTIKRCDKPIGSTGRNCILHPEHAGICEGPSPAIARSGFVTADPANPSKRIGYYDTKLCCQTLDKAADDEPIFVIRATDETSAAAIQAWLCLNPGISPEKKERAIIAMLAMRNWKSKRKAD